MIVAVRVRRVLGQRDVRLAGVLEVLSATAARYRLGHIAEPVGREEPDAARQERQEHGERSQDEHTMSSHRPHTSLLVGINRLFSS